MRILISVDMEGITGVTTPADTTPGEPGWTYFRRFLTGDVNAAIEGAFAGGATSVIVTEAHSGHKNLLLDELDPRALAIVGRHKRYAMVEGIERDIDRVFFVGYHGGAGTEGVLSHTFSAANITGITINGIPASEGYINALIAGAYGVPVTLVTGDDVACHDAIEHIPNVVTAQVKEAISRFTALCLPPSQTSNLIRDAAERATRLARPNPLQLGTKLTWAIEFVGTNSVAAVQHLPGVKRVDARHVEFEASDPIAAWPLFHIVNSTAQHSMETRFL